MIATLLKRVLRRRHKEPAPQERGNASAAPSGSSFENRGKKKPSSRERDIRKDEKFVEFFERCAPYSLTTLERLYGLYSSVEYIVQNNLPGDIVECGVWRGGSMMMAALSLRHFNDVQDRRLVLFDTFEGMPEPTELDYKFDGLNAEEKWEALRRKNGSAWNYASVDTVREAMQTTGYPEDKIILVKGRVENTLPDMAPERVALLRLDTDFYASTRHEMKHLYPRLISGGVLILDDFGTWAGSRRAVEEYFDEHKIMMLLNRIDASGRVGVKR